MNSPALQELHRINADLLTLYEWHADPDGGAIPAEAWPTLKKLSDKLADAVNKMEKELKERSYDEHAAARWNYLFDPAVAFHKRSGEWFLYFRVDSTSLKLIGSGADLVELVDKQLENKL